VARPTRKEPRFRAGDRVRLLSTMRPQYSGQHAVVQSLSRKSRYSHQLDKYLVRVDGQNSDIEVFDIELEK
jgi:hypothetical protein